MSEEADIIATLQTKLRKARVKCDLSEVAAKEIEGGVFAALLCVLDGSEGKSRKTEVGDVASDELKGRPRFARAAELLSELLPFCPAALSLDVVLSCLEAVCAKVERTSQVEEDGGDTKQMLAFGCHSLWVAAGAFRERRGGRTQLQCDEKRVDKLEERCLSAASTAALHSCFKARVETKAQVGSGRFRFGLGVAARAVARLREVAEMREEKAAAARITEDLR